MIHDLTGHVAVVTGGNAGIGLGLARGLARDGATVVVWGTNAERNASAAAELGVSAMTVDVSDADQVRAAMDQVVDQHGRLDSCFANAGVGAVPYAVDELPEDEWRRVLDVNLDGVLTTLQAAATHLKRQGDGGSLVATSSVGSIHGMPRALPYAAGKGAVVALVRSLAVELARESVTVNAVLPGWIDTAMTSAMLATEPARTRILPRIPARRWGTPEDFEAVASFLVGPGSRYLTGQVLTIDGGYSVF